MRSFDIVLCTNGNARLRGGAREQRVGVVHEQAVQPRRRDHQRHGRRRTEDGRGERTVRHVHQLARQEAPVGVGCPVARQARFLLGAALEVLEHEARQPRVRHRAQVLDRARARHVAPGVEPPRR
jgi:hypothetical protein